MSEQNNENKKLTPDELLESLLGHTNISTEMGEQIIRLTSKNPACRRHYRKIARSVEEALKHAARFSNSAESVLNSCISLGAVYGALLTATGKLNVQIVTDNSEVVVENPGKLKQQIVQSIEEDIKKNPAQLENGCEKVRIDVYKNGLYVLAVSRSDTTLSELIDSLFNAAQNMPSPKQPKRRMNEEEEQD